MPVDIAQRGVGFLAIRPRAMARAVDRVEIERDEFGADFGRPAQPVEHRIDALGVRNLHAEGLPVAGHRPICHRAVAHCRSAPGHGRAGPEHGGAADARFLGLDPDRLGFAPPIGIDRGHGEGIVGARGIFHAVGGDAVMIGHQAGHQRPVIGEGLGREGRPHRRARTVAGQLRERRGQPAFEIVRVEAVDRYQDRYRFALLGHRHAGDWRIGIGGAAAQHAGKTEGEGGGNPVHGSDLRR